MAIRMLPKKASTPNGTECTTSIYGILNVNAMVPANRQSERHVIIKHAINEIVTFILVFKLLY
mgnify:CR=1 FL=1